MRKAQVKYREMRPFVSFLKKIQLPHSQGQTKKENATLNYGIIYEHQRKKQILFNKAKHSVK